MVVAGLRSKTLLPLLLASSFAVGCDEIGTASFATGEIEVGFAATSLDVPEPLREGGRVAELPCAESAMCPSNDVISVACSRSLCNPRPRTITTQVEDVIDFDELVGDLSPVFRTVDAIEVTEVAYTVELNTLAVDVSEVEVYWGPEGAVEVDSSLGVHLLATLPRQRARMTSSGMADIDLGGSQALSDHLVSVSRRIRLFVRTEVDLEPGDSLPEGEIQASLMGTVRVSGPTLD